MKIYNSEQERLEDLARQAERVQSENRQREQDDLQQRQDDFQRRVNISPRKDEISRLKSLNPFANPGDLEQQAVQNIANMSNEEKLQKYYELHPELNPNKPKNDFSKLDPSFLEQFIRNKGDPIPNPRMSVGSDAPFYSEADHPMSIGQPAKTELPPIQEVLAQKPQQTLTREPQQAPIRQVSDEEAMGGMRSQPQSSSELSNIMFGKNDLSTIDNLKKAQQERDSNQRSARFIRGAALIGEGLSGIKNTGANEIASDIDKTSGQPIQDLEQQTAMQKQDPNSAVSKGYRDMMKQFGVNVQGDASAADMEKIAPWIAKAYEGEQSREAKSEDLKYKYNELSAYKKIKGDERKEKDQNDYLERANKQLGKKADEYQKVAQAEELADTMDMTNAASQVGLLYNMVKALDESSAVKEGEVQLARSIGGLPGTIDVVLSQLTADPQLINERVVKDIKAEIKRIATVSKKHYAKSRDTFSKGATSRGISEDRFGEFDRYHDDLKSGGYSESQERGIKRVMDTNKVSREEAMSALKKAGKL